MNNETQLNKHVADLHLKKFFCALAVVAGLFGLVVLAYNLVPCGRIGANTDLPIQISSITPHPTYRRLFRVTWTGCKLTGGTIKIYLVHPQSRIAFYCGTGTLRAQLASEPNSQTVVVTFQTGDVQPQNTYQTQRSVVATFSDGSQDKWSNTNYVSVSCD